MRWEGAIEARFLKALQQAGGVWVSGPSGKPIGGASASSEARNTLGPPAAPRIGGDACLERCQAAEGLPRSPVLTASPPLPTRACLPQEAKPKAILQRMGAYSSQLTTIQVRGGTRAGTWLCRLQAESSRPSLPSPAAAGAQSWHSTHPTLLASPLPSLKPIPHMPQVKSHLQKHRIKVAAEMQRQGVTPNIAGSAGTAAPLQAARAAAQQQAAQQRLATAAAAAAQQMQQKVVRQMERAAGVRTAPAPTRPKKQRPTVDVSGSLGQRRPSAAPASPAPSTPQQPLPAARYEVHAAPSPHSLPQPHPAYAHPAHGHAVMGQLVPHPHYHPGTVQHMQVHAGHPGGALTTHPGTHLAPLAYPVVHQGTAAHAHPHHAYHEAEPGLMLEPAYLHQDSPLSGGGSSAGAHTAWDLASPGSARGSQQRAGQAVAAQAAQQQALARYPSGSHHAAAAHHQQAAYAAYGHAVHGGAYGTTHFAMRHASMAHLHGHAGELAPQPTAPAALWTAAAPAGSCSWHDLSGLDAAGSAPAVLATGPAASSAAAPTHDHDSAAPTPCAVPPSPQPAAGTPAKGMDASAHHPHPHQHQHQQPGIACGPSDSDCGADCAFDAGAAFDDLLYLPALPAEDMAALKHRPLAGADPFGGLGLEEANTHDLSWALGSGIF